MPEVSEGSVVDGRYRVLRRLGSGGMADVWLAEDTHLQRQVALKVLHRRFAQDREFVERFRREAESAARPAAPEHRLRLSTAASSRAPTTSPCSTSRARR